MTPEQIKTVVMLWNFFKSIDLELNGDAWIQFDIGGEGNSNRIIISRTAIEGQEFGTVDYRHTLDVHVSGMWIDDLNLGADVTIDVSHSDRFEINGASFHNPLMYPSINIEELKAVKITCFNAECSIVFQNITTF